MFETLADSLKLLSTGSGRLMGTLATALSSFAQGRWKRMTSLFRTLTSSSVVSILGSPFRMVYARLRPYLGLKMGLCSLKKREPGWMQCLKLRIKPVGLTRRGMNVATLELVHPCEPCQTEDPATSRSQVHFVSRTTPTSAREAIAGL